MNYQTIPLPNYSFTEIVERQAEQFYRSYFQPNYLQLNLDSMLDEVNKLYYNQVTKQDKIVTLSYLINKLSEKILKLQAEVEIDEWQDILHRLYGLINQEGIEIPTDFFSKESYSKAESLVVKINEIIEQLKIDNPEHTDALNDIKNEVANNKTFLGFGIKKYFEMIIGAVIGSAIQNAVLPLILKSFILLETDIYRLLNAHIV